jgi:hypothetical protein
MTEPHTAKILQFPVRRRMTLANSYVEFWLALWQANFKFWIG